jgi:hypothetical protein
LTNEKKEGDFFHEHSQAPAKTTWEENVTLSSHSSNQSLDKSNNDFLFIRSLFSIVLS